MLDEALEEEDALLQRRINARLPSVSKAEGAYLTSETLSKKIDSLQQTNVLKAHEATLLKDALWDCTRRQAPLLEAEDMADLLEAERKIEQKLEQLRLARQSSSTQ